jgi:hypothetical protein
MKLNPSSNTPSNAKTLKCKDDKIKTLEKKLKDLND